MKIPSPSVRSFQAVFTLLGVLCCGLFGSAFAQTKTWLPTGTGVPFTTATNWSPTGVPGASDVITSTVSNPATTQISSAVTISGIDYDLATGGWTFNSPKQMGGILFTVTGTIEKSGGSTLTFSKSSGTPNATVLQMSIGTINLSGGNMTFGGGHASSLGQLTVTNTQVSAGVLGIDVVNDYSLGNVTTSGTGAISLNTDAQDLGSTGGTQNINLTSLQGTGGTIEASTTTLAGTENAILVVNQSTNTTAATTLINGPSSTASNLSLTKTGVGSLILTGTSNTYTGATTVTGGTLGATVAGAMSSTSALTVGVVSGTATFAVGHAAGGATFATVSPLSLALITTTGAGTEAVLKLDLGPTTNDSITTGAFTVTSGQKFDLVLTETAGAPTAQETLLTWTSGGLADLSQIDLTGSSSGITTSNLSISGDGHSLLFNAVAVPEPKTWAFLLVGVIALGCWRRQKGFSVAGF